MFFTQHHNPTIEVDQRNKLFTVRFEVGSKQAVSGYEETIEMAETLARYSNNNHWLMIKRDFSDMSTDHFLLLVRKCYQSLSRQEKCCRMAIYTKEQAFKKLKKKYDWLKKLPQEFDIGIFENIGQAYAYLENA